MPRRRAAAVVVALVIICVLPPAAPAANLGGPAIVKKLNKLRAKIGVPPVTHSAAQSSGCLAHDRWMHRNHLLQHEEIKGTPGYSRAGALAGSTSVLSQGPSWRRGVPWINAPIHMMAILDPQPLFYGGYELGARGMNWNCLGPDTEKDHRTYSAERFFAWPPVRDVPAQQQAYEAPYPPQVKLGYSRKAVTGPNILLWWVGPTGSLAPKSATLTAAGRPVPVKLGASPAQFPGVRDVGYGYGNHAFAIPPKLKAGVLHELKVVWALPADQVGATNCPPDFDFATQDPGTCPIAQYREAIQTFAFKPKAYRSYGSGQRVKLGKNGKPVKRKRR